MIDEIIEANVAEFGSLSVGAISDIKKGEDMITPYHEMVSM